MSSTPGSQMLASFHHIRDVFINASKLLQASDPLLQDHLFSPYGRTWKPFEPRRELTQPHLWLPQTAVRQFYLNREPQRTILTVGVLFWDESPVDDVMLAEPLAMASFMRVKATPDSVYWLSLLQGWTKNCPPDGRVRTIQNQVKEYEPYYAAVLEDPNILTVARPLLEITNTEELNNQLIVPLIAALKESKL